VLIKQVVLLNAGSLAHVFKSGGGSIFFINRQAYDDVPQVYFFDGRPTVKLSRYF